MQRRQAVTIRFPVELIGEARETRSEQESLNDLVVDAVRREVRRRRGMEAFEAIRRIRGEVKAQIGSQPDSVPMIRRLREGIGRRD